MQRWAALWWYSVRLVAIIVVLLLAGALTLATCGTAHASGSGLPSLPEAPELDHYSEYGQFGITACALVGQAALDAKMTRRWYRAAAHMLRGCGRITTARIAERKARRRGMMDQ